MSAASESIRQIPVDLIRSGSTQARRRFDSDRLRELAESIRESGLIQPVVVRSIDGGFELLAGERRWRAAQLVGVHEIPAIVRDDLADDEAHVLGLIENLQRESLTPIETAQGLRQLAQRTGMTHEQLAERVGKSRVYITNFLRLLNLVPAVQTMVDEGSLSSGHAKVLASVAPDKQLQWARDAVRRKLNVRALERQLSSDRRAPATSPAKDGDWRRLERAVAEQLGYPVSIEAADDGRGELRVRFHSLEELDGVLQRIGYDASNG
ncbi:MAG: ParB/RepB/Spo0J family partition protein [Pseudomonadota bacterium]|nr:ParB/RepB/Spo0J family partition protein [Pseudomonadota bacterium]